ncbi:enoyl-CoA hydratase-related protein [Symbiobacterium terraclitae]|uniref:enoyl-CoA hydratase-related protein n=1 Tax=Symbiobacterium terraclitae TaxID=557451 RepID=UPI0035B52988
MKRVLLTREGPIAWVALNNPERHNALSAQVVADLQEAADQLAVDRSLRVVVLHGGEAKSFCSGADLKERQGMEEAAVVATVHALREAVNSVAQLPVPVIAAIHGMAFGGGLELALACDIRIAADDAQMGLTEVGWGIIPGAGGCARLPALIGPAKAKELIFTARRLTAGEALELGLVNRVVDRPNLLDAARAMAEQIARQAPLAVRAAKRAIDAGPGLAAGLAAEWREYRSIVQTQDRLEGLRAFAERRPPVFRGE